MLCYRCSYFIPYSYVLSILSTFLFYFFILDSCNDFELPTKMALLDLGGQEGSPGTSTMDFPEEDMITPPTRTLRNRRIIRLDSQKVSRKNGKRRCYTTPRRRSQSIDSSDLSSANDMLCVFRSGGSRRSLQHLETIHEEPHLYKGSLSYLGPLKVRRILFNGINKTKTKKRKAKVKKLSTKISKIKKIPLDDFIKKLHSLEKNPPDLNVILS